MAGEQQRFGDGDEHERPWVESVHLLRPVGKIGRELDERQGRNEDLPIGEGFRRCKSPQA
jgi:hypothetical protein